MTVAVAEKNSKSVPRLGKIQVDGTGFEYVEAGQGHPVVYLHGSDGLRLSQAHRTLSENYRLLAFDVPELNGSLAQNTSVCLEDLAKSLSDAFAQLGLDRFSLMGHSIGADLCLWLAAANVEKVDAVILSAPTAIRFPPEGGKLPPKKGGDHQAADAWFVKGSDVTQESVVQQHVDRLLGKLRDPALEEKMGTIKAPVVALFGTMDRIVSTKAARIYCELLPKCFPMMVYEASHSIDLDRPHAVADITKNFLEHKESFVVNRDSGIVNP